MVSKVATGPGAPLNAAVDFRLKVPPTVLFAVTALLMHAVARWTPAGWSHPSVFTRVAAVMVAAAGAVIIGAAVAAFVRARTTTMPMQPENASALVTHGVYGITRNPMYAGLLLLLLGWALWLGSVAAAVLPAGFVVYLNQFQIAPEEAALRARFGASYDEYQRRVRRWL